MLKQPATAIYYPLSCVLAGIDKFAGCRSVAVPSTIERSTSLSRYTRHTVARSIHRTRWSIIASLRLGTFRSFILYVAILLSADRVLPLSPRLDKITWISIVSSLNGILDVCWNRCQPAAADFYSACSNVGKLANLNCNLFSTGGRLIFRRKWREFACSSGVICCDTFDITYLRTQRVCIIFCRMNIQFFLTQYYTTIGY